MRPYDMTHRRTPQRTMTPRPPQLIRPIHLIAPLTPPLWPPDSVVTSPLAPWGSGLGPVGSPPSIAGTDGCSIRPQCSQRFRAPHTRRS